MATKLRRSNFHTDADNHVNESINAKLATNLGNISTGNITTTGYIAGPATFTIDPAAVGDNTGTLIVAGNLQVDGTTTTINSTTLEVDDLNITLASGAANATAANGAGITVDGASATITYASASDAWSFNKNVGIGTSSPSFPLESVSATFAYMRTRSTNSAYTGFDVGQHQNGQAVLNLRDNNFMHFHTNDTERMRIEADGSVKIPNQNAINELTFTGPEFTNIFSQSTSGFQIGTTASGYLAFLTNNTERMHIDASGRVCIGGVEATVFNGVGGDMRFVVIGDDSTTTVANNSDAGIAIVNTNQTAGNLAGLHFARADTDDTPNYAGASIVAQFPEAQVTGQYPKGDLAFLTSTATNYAPSEKMRITSSGNVGIGTSSPNKSLTVATPQTANTVMEVLRLTGSGTYNSSGSSEAGAGVSFGQYSGTYPSWNLGQISGVRSGASWDGALIFSTNSGSTETSITERMRIDSNGNVGIGTTSIVANSKLNVVQGVVASNDGAVNPYFQTYNSDAGTDLKYWRFGGQDDGKFLFQTVNDAYSSATTRLTIDSSGRVGIGTAPAGGVQLDVRGTGVLQLVNTDTVQLLASSGGSILKNVSNNPLLFGTNNTERMRILSTGDIAFGNTAANLVSNTSTQGGGGYVTSDKHFEFATNSNRSAVEIGKNNANDGQLVVFRKQGNVVGSVSVTSSGTTYNTSSDIRLKIDILPIADATDKLMAMNAVTHKWKNDPDADSIHGFIAQEMQDIVPEAVSGDAASEDIMSMDYGRITPVIVAALQDALKEIDMLKNRITELEAK